MCDDRTSEFQALGRTLPGAESYRRNNHSLPGSSSSGLITQNNNSPQHSITAGGTSTFEGGTNKGTAAKNNPAYAELRSFQLTAGGISQDICATSALLTELTNLVRNQSSLLTDRSETERINELVVRIKGSIENLNFRLDQAGQVIARQKRKLGQHSQAGQQASNLVDGLKTEFAQAASGFKKVLQQRTDTMKEADYLQRQVYGGGNTNNTNNLEDDDDPIPNMSLAAPPPVFGDAAGGGIGAGSANGGTGSMAAFPTLDLTSGMMSAGEATGPALPRPHGINYAGNGSSTTNATTPFYLGDNLDDDDTGGGGGNSIPVMTPLDIQRMEQESGLQTQLIPDSQYLQNRAEAMSAVEAHITELGTVFNRLAGMVQEQREMVHRVEDNVDDANTNIGLSLNVLTDTLHSLRTNKSLALRVLAVLVVFSILFVVFFA